MARSDTPPRTPSGAARLRRRRGGRPHAPRLRPVWLILAILGVFALGLHLSGGLGEFLQNLYSPVAIIVVVFLVIEYIVLEGRDRSRIYRIELDQMREKRRLDAAFLREVEDELRRLEDGFSDPASSNPSPQPADRAGLRERLAALRRRLSQRL